MLWFARRRRRRNGFAVNNTGTAIVRGAKAWLNRHNLDENTAYQHYAGGSSTQYAPVLTPTTISGW